MITRKIKPVHPGEILFEEFLRPMELSQTRLALDIGVPPRRINEIVHGKRRITADTALRLARYFGMSPQFWLGLRNHKIAQANLARGTASWEAPGGKAPPSKAPGFIPVPLSKLKR